MKHIKKHILTLVLISIILALILNIKENKNIADDILFLKSIQKNEEERKDISNRSRETAEEVYSWEAVEKEYLENIK